VVDIILEHARICALIMLGMGGNSGVHIDHPQFKSCRHFAEAFDAPLDRFCKQVAERQRWTERCRRSSRAPARFLLILWNANGLYAPIDCASRIGAVVGDRLLLSLPIDREPSRRDSLRG
jgi:hypothetical protein